MTDLAPGGCVLSVPVVGSASSGAASCGSLAKKGNFGLHSARPPAPAIPAPSWLPGHRRIRRCRRARRPPEQQSGERHRDGDRAE